MPSDAAQRARQKKLADRRSARRKILTAANGVRAQWSRKRYTMKHIQEAVCSARRLQLVKPEVIVAAGFQPSREAIQQPPQAERARRRALRLAARAARKASA